MEIESIDLHIAKYLATTEQEQEVIARLSAATREGHLCIETKETITVEGVVQEGNLLYFDKAYHLVKLIRDKVEEMQAPMPPITQSVPELSDEQNRVVKEASKTSLAFISGGPGTGKTYTAGWLVRLLCKKNTSIALTAPTGKAAHRLKASIERVLGKENPNIHASTLHALLKYGSPQADLHSLPEDLILVDESSMLDVNLLALLLKKVKKGARLILMGDPDQLPPIGGGTLFADLVNQKAHLSTCIRIENPAILELAKAVNAQDVEQVKQLITPHPFKGIKQIVRRVIDKDPSFDNFRLLCPIKRGFCGSDAINRALFEAFGAKEVPIIITKNDYEKGLFNGECGTISLTKEEFHSVVQEKKTLRSLKGATAHFDTIGSFPVALLPPFDLAYCLSVHKSQGSEYQDILLFLPDGSHTFGKEMLYTAITRAKSNLVLYSSKEELEKTLSISTRRLSGNLS